MAGWRKLCIQPAQPGAVAIRPAIIPMTDGAKLALDDATAHFSKMRKQAHAHGECYYALWGRAREHAIKLALCGHAGGVIDAPCMVWACGLVDCLTIRLIERLKRSLFVNEHEKETQRVLSIIEAAGGEWVSRSEIYNKTRSLQARQRNDILTTLAEAELIQVGAGEIKKGQTKPAILYRIK